MQNNAFQPGAVVFQSANEDVLHMIWRRRGSILLILALIFLAAVVYLRRVTPVYVVTSELYIEKKTLRDVGDRPLDYLYTQSALLRSTPVLRLALDSIDVAQFPELANLRRPVAYLKEKLAVDVGKRDGIFTVSLRASDPSQGASLLNSIIEAYIAYQARDALPPPASVLVLEPADPQFAVAKPAAAQVLSLALALGLFLGIASALLRGRLDHTLHTPEDALRIGPLPLAALIPHWPDHPSNPICNDQPPNPLSDACRTLAAAIQFGAPGDRARSILVTSPLSNDGKSTIASGLAVAFAHASQRTLLLDLNGRAPAVPSACPSANNAVHKTAVDALDTLAYRPTASALSHKDLSDLLCRLASEYDRIVVDAPALLPCADARIGSALCDLTLLVLRVGKSTSDDYARAYATLTAVHARPFGLVINQTRAAPTAANHRVQPPSPRPASPQRPSEPAPVSPEPSQHQVA